MNQESEIRATLLQVAHAPSPGALGAAQQAVAGVIEDRPRSRRRRWSAGIAALLAATLALSPPGQAIAERIGELVGIGEESSVTDDNLRDPRLSSQQDRVGPAIVTATGSILGADLPFEIVGWAAREKAPTGPVWPDGADSAEGTLSTCLGVVLPTRGRQETGKWCQGEDGSERVPDPFHVFGGGSSSAVVYGPNAPYEFVGATTAEVARVELAYTDDSGERRAGDTTLGMLDGELLHKTGGTLPFGFFVSQIPYDGLPRDEFGYTGSPAAESAVITAYDEAGNALGSQKVGKRLRRARLSVRRPQPIPAQP